MISLFYEKDHEMVGNLEVRHADWQELRKEGATRFILRLTSKNLVSRVGGFCLLSAALDMHDRTKIGPTNWMLIVFGLYCITVSLITAARTWFRLEQRFNRDDSATT